MAAKTKVKLKNYFVAGTISNNSNSNNVNVTIRCINVMSKSSTKGNCITRITSICRISLFLLALIFLFFGPIQISAKTKKLNQQSVESVITPIQVESQLTSTHTAPASTTSLAANPNAATPVSANVVQQIPETLSAAKTSPRAVLFTDSDTQRYTSTKQFSDGSRNAAKSSAHQSDSHLQSDLLTSQTGKDKKLHSQSMTWHEDRDDEINRNSHIDDMDNSDSNAATSDTVQGKTTSQLFTQLDPNPSIPMAKENVAISTEQPTPTAQSSQLHSETDNTFKQAEVAAHSNASEVFALTTILEDSPQPLSSLSSPSSPSSSSSANSVQLDGAASADHAQLSESSLFESASSSSSSLLASLSSATQISSSSTSAVLHENVELESHSNLSCSNMSNMHESLKPSQDSPMPNSMLLSGSVLQPEGEVILRSGDDSTLHQPPSIVPIGISMQTHSENNGRTVSPSSGAAAGIDLSLSAALSSSSSSSSPSLHTSNSLESLSAFNERMLNDFYSLSTASKRKAVARLWSESGSSENGAPDRFNYASADAGAKLLYSTDGMKRANSILVNDDDRYLMVPCDEKEKSFIIQLSEDIVLDSVVISNLEHYSSSVHEFELLGSHKYPTERWQPLGKFFANQIHGKESFTVSPPEDDEMQSADDLWVRYVQFRWLTHLSDEYYCTMTNFRVQGHTMLEFLQAIFEESTMDVQNFLSEMQTKRNPPKHHDNTQSSIPNAETYEPTTILSDSQHDSKSKAAHDSVLDSPLPLSTIGSEPFGVSEAQLSASNSPLSTSSTARVESFPPQELLADGDGDTVANIISNANGNVSGSLSSIDVSKLNVSPPGLLSSASWVEHLRGRVDLNESLVAELNAMHVNASDELLDFLLGNVSMTIAANGSSTDSAPVANANQIAGSPSATPTNPTLAASNNIAAGGTSASAFTSASHARVGVASSPTTSSPSPSSSAASQNIFRTLAMRITELELHQAVSAQYVDELSARIRADLDVMKGKWLHTENYLKSMIEKYERVVASSLITLNDTRRAMQSEGKSLLQIVESRLQSLHELSSIMENMFIIECILLGVFLMAWIAPAIRRAFVQACCTSTHSSRKAKYTVVLNSPTPSDLDKSSRMLRTQSANIPAITGATLPATPSSPYFPLFTEKPTPEQPSLSSNAAPASSFSSSALFPPTAPAGYRSASPSPSRSPMQHSHKRSRHWRDSESYYPLTFGTESGSELSDCEEKHENEFEHRARQRDRTMDKPDTAYVPEEPPTQLSKQNVTSLETKEQVEHTNVPTNSTSNGQVQHEQIPPQTSAVSVSTASVAGANGSAAASALRGSAAVSRSSSTAQSVSRSALPAVESQSHSQSQSQSQPAVNRRKSKKHKKKSKDTKTPTNAQLNLQKLTDSKSQSGMPSGNGTVTSASTPPAARSISSSLFSSFSAVLFKTYPQSKCSVSLSASASSSLSSSAAGSAISSAANSVLHSPKLKSAKMSHRKQRSNSAIFDLPPLDLQLIRSHKSV